MRYVIAYYNPNQATKNTDIPIGVILQSNNKIDCKFYNNFRKIRGFDPKADRLSFESKENSFKKRFKERYAVISSPSANSEKVSVFDEVYLRSLNQNSMGTVQFSEVSHTEVMPFQKALTNLYKTEVSSKI